MNKKEKEIIAQIRNDFTPVLNYFALREEVKNSKLSPEQKKDLYSLIEIDDDTSQKNMKNIKKMLDLLG